jgi:hypothetical protein
LYLHLLILNVEIQMNAALITRLPNLHPTSAQFPRGCGDAVAWRTITPAVILPFETAGRYQELNIQSIYPINPNIHPYNHGSFRHPGQEEPQAQRLWLPPSPPDKMVTAALFNNPPPDNYYHEFKSS